MPRTYSEIFAIVAALARINTNDTNLTNLVKDAIDMAFYDVAREHRWPELLVLRVSLDLTGAAAGSLIAVPDHIGVEEVKYINNSPFRSWELVEKNQLVPPAPLYNKPRSYQIVVGLPETATNYQMSLEPFELIDEDDDTLLFSYYKVPELFSSMAGPTLINSVNWDNQVIKQAEHYVLTFMGQTDKAAEIWKEVLGRMTKQSNETQTAS